VTLREVAGDLADCLVSIWLPDPGGRRPVYGGVERVPDGPGLEGQPAVLRVLHGDNGAGLGAMHQTGWTALVADLLLDPPRRSRHLMFNDAEPGTSPEC
jgi:hypothetical protein